MPSGVSEHIASSAHSMVARGNVPSGASEHVVGIGAAEHFGIGATEHSIPIMEVAFKSDTWWYIPEE
eukprot:11186203-Lingulodinium_polyedra.AAC.1